MDQIKIGEFVARKRKEKNLTQEQLAEKLGVSNKTVSKWETGKCMPDYSVVKELCVELGITVSELLDGEEQKDDKDHSYNEAHVIELLKRNQELEKQRSYDVNQTVKKGISFGSALAMVISYVNIGSVGWAIVHGLLGWLYVIYYVVRYII